MKVFKYLLVVTILAVPAFNVLAQGRSVAKQLRQAFEQEKAGDLDGAIQTYEQITTDIEANQRQVAQAYYRMGMCYLKKGDQANAEQQFQHLVSGFPRNLTAVANARRELRRIQRQERGTQMEGIRTRIPGRGRIRSTSISPKGAPTVVSTEPANFADNVSADLRQISVTFDQQMMNRSWSWTQLDRRTFPKMMGKPRYDMDRRICTLRVKLRPRTVYFVGINYDPSEGSLGQRRPRRGFKSALGKEAKPYALVFATADVMGRSMPIPEDLLVKAKAINSAAETDVEPPESEPMTFGQELFHDDGFKLGRTGFASVSASYVRFETPKPNSYLKAVRIFGVRPGEVETTDPYIHILVCDSDFTALADFQFPLDRFERRFRDWVTLTIEPTKIPSKFAIGLTHQEEALAVGFDLGKSTNSFFKKPGVGVRPYSGGDWLIRAIVSDSPDMPISVTKGPGGDELLAMVPAESLFCVQVNNFDYTLSQIDQFLAGVSPIPMGVSMLVRRQLAKVLGSPELKGVKMGGSFAIFGTAARGESMQPDLVSILVPTTDYRQFVSGNPNINQPDDKGISKITSVGGLVTQLNNFALIKPPSPQSYRKLAAMARMISEGKLPSLASALDTAEAKQAAEQPIWVHGDIEQVSKTLGPLLFGTLQQAKTAMEQMRTAGKAPIGAPEKVIDIYIKLLETLTRQTRSLTIAVNPKPNVLNITCTVSALPGTKWADTYFADPAAMRKLSDKLKEPKQMGAGIKPIMAVLPQADKADFVGTYNLVDLIKMILALASVPMSEIDIPTKSNIALAGKVSKGTMTVDIALPKEHLTELVTGATMMQPQMQPLVSEDVGPDEDWGSRYFGPDFRSKNALQLKIANVTDDAIEDVITEKLKKMTDGDRYSWVGRKVGDNLYVQLSPVRDVEGFMEKIDFGTVVARKGRRVIVKAKSNWTDEDFRFGPDPEYTVRLIIIGVTDSAAEEAIKEKLKQLMGSERFYLAWSKIHSAVTADVAPVDDVGAFVKKIDFGNVTSIRGRRVEVKVGGTTR